MALPTHPYLLPLTVFSLTFLFSIVLFFLHSLFFSFFVFASLSLCVFFLFIFLFEEEALWDFQRFWTLVRPRQSFSFEIPIEVFRFSLHVLPPPSHRISYLPSYNALTTVAERRERVSRK